MALEGMMWRNRPACHDVGMGWAVREAEKARGLDPDAGSPLARLRKNVPLRVPAFLSTIRMTGQQT